MNFKRLEHTLGKLNTFSKQGQGINRLAYTDEERQATQYIIDLCEKEGMEVNVDTVGNVIARRKGTNSALPAVACGSHIDSVYEAGKYDGTVGVVAALEVIRSLNDDNIRTEHPIEMIVFACEESARFGFSTLGSKAMAGLLKKEDITNLKDKQGISIQREFSKYGLNVNEIKEAERSKEVFKVFLELHIEQGPVLEKEGKQIGIVTGIAGPTRFKLQIQGQASHSGSTPMNYRKDAFLGAAEIALTLEEAAQSEASRGTVATVGVCDVNPGAMNIVPGMVEMGIDIRGISIESKEVVIKELYHAMQRIEKQRELKMSIIKLNDEAPVKMDENMIDSIKETCEQYGNTYTLMPSGAGHDVMNMAQLSPSVLFFIPSRNGLSHNPEEYTSLEHIAMGAFLLKEEILKHAKVSQKLVR